MAERRLIAGAELAAAAALLAWNAAINRVVPSPAYVPANLAAAGLSLASARRRGVPVLVTSAAGLGFSWLRFRGDSLLAPAVAHAALNSSAFAAARLVTRSARR